MLPSQFVNPVESIHLYEHLFARDTKTTMLPVCLPYTNSLLGTFEVEGAHELGEHAEEEVAGLAQELPDGGLAQLRAPPQKARCRPRLRLRAQQPDRLHTAAQCCSGTVTVRVGRQGLCTSTRARDDSGITAGTAGVAVPGDQQ